MGVVHRTMSAIDPAACNQRFSEGQGHLCIVCIVAQRPPKGMQEAFKEGRKEGRKEREDIMLYIYIKIITG